jgi:riboflavin kinase/FMN adenylyltransferase
MKFMTNAGPVGEPPQPVSLAVGVFDGAHLGHASVIQETLREAKRHGGVAVAVTFDRHPTSVLAPDRAPPMIYPLWRRLEALEDLGMGAALVFAFDEEFSRQPATVFVERLLAGFQRVAAIVVGTNFVFGHGRSGNVALLERMAAERGFVARAVPGRLLGGEIISSTRVRERIAAGDFEGASELLGRPYALAGEVEAGDRLGRTLGFPTANLRVDGLALPPPGVYAARAVMGKISRPAAVNVGTRPSIQANGATVRVEAHLLDFAGDLYGERMELEFRFRIRGEERFPSRDALARRIGEDVEAVRAWAGNKGLL